MKKIVYLYIRDIGFNLCHSIIAKPFKNWFYYVKAASWEKMFFSFLNQFNLVIKRNVAGAMFVNAPDDK